MFKNFLKIVVIFLVATGVSAQAAVLNSVEVKNSGPGYKIILNTDKKIKVKKTRLSDHEVRFQLNGTASAPSLTTKYDNAPSVDNIGVSSSGNSTFVTVNGVNAADYDIVSSDDVAVPVDTTKSDLAVYGCILAFVAACGLVSGARSKSRKDSLAVQNAFNRQIRQNKIEREQQHIRKLKTLREQKTSNPLQRKTFAYKDFIGEKHVANM